MCPASISVLTDETIEQSPALMADDVLRQVPTFSLFRRTSSLVAQPTTQGVSLRGIGPSGQSRTLVLLDGIPFNDPFGGWVYWSRVPLASVDRVEITRVRRRICTATSRWAG
jgi:outer membrane receptor for ferrienterochelin and colicin